MTFPYFSEHHTENTQKRPNRGTTFPAFPTVISASNVYEKTMATAQQTSTSSSGKPKDKKSQEEIYAEFQQLRNQQRNLINNLNTLEMDLKEHKTVIDTLKTVEPGRKCFRLIGGVLCEQTVEVVLPQLVQNKEQLEKLIENGKDQISKKGVEINQFKDEYNIKIRGQDSAPAAASEKESTDDKTPASGNRNVLVGNL
ncbi:probable prefoldin subunit 2 [Toxorhynchites rutilus septentrionalis]|uniref:probable prefoldin subunit 2 n=1 Tax=Toxorhynchites rutilus septentrionalis TaxID=329112 RepID=UPI00247AE603|nr:probable prefoldin subunit 2 [Toxorhynchites rutilus septentrionalis]